MISKLNKDGEKVIAVCWKKPAAIVSVIFFQILLFLAGTGTIYFYSTGKIGAFSAFSSSAFCIMLFLLIWFRTVFSYCLTPAALIEKRLFTGKLYEYTVSVETEIIPLVKIGYTMIGNKNRIPQDCIGGGYIFKFSSGTVKINAGDMKGAYQLAEALKRVIEKNKRCTAFSE